MGKEKDKSSSSFLSGEDHDLWQRFTATAIPLREKDRNRAENIPITSQPAAKTPSTDRKNAGRTEITHDRKETGPSLPPKPPPLSDMDRRKIRRIATDQIVIDATLDLHGLRQEDAHISLKSFIRSSRAQNFRYVLVITGKGGSRKNTDPAEWKDPEPGVLRRSVPIWLSDSELREHVVGYTNAHSRHGGNGALYVQIRKLKKIT